MQYQRLLRFTHAAGVAEVQFVAVKRVLVALGLEHARAERELGRDVDLLRPRERERVLGEER